MVGTVTLEDEGMHNGSILRGLSQVHGAAGCYCYILALAVLENDGEQLHQPVYRVNLLGNHKVGAQFPTAKIL